MEKKIDDGFKVTVRVSQENKAALEKLIPKKYLNISDAIRDAIRRLVEEKHDSKMQVLRKRGRIGNRRALRSVRRGKNGDGGMKMNANTTDAAETKGRLAYICKDCGKETQKKQSSL